MFVKMNQSLNIEVVIVVRGQDQNQDPEESPLKNSIIDGEVILQSLVDFLMTPLHRTNFTVQNCLLKATRTRGVYVTSNLNLNTQNLFFSELISSLICVGSPMMWPCQLDDKTA